MPRVKPQRVIRIGFNFNTILLVISIVFILSFVFSQLNSSLDASEVSMSEFVSNIKNNQYSSVDIRDDGRAVAKSKYVFTTNTLEELDLKQTEQTQVLKLSSSDLQEITLDELYDMVRPLNFRELVDAVTNPASVTRASDVFVGEGLILADSASGEKDFLLTQAGEEQFLDMLDQKGADINELPVRVHFLRTVVSEKNNETFLKFFDADKFTNAWVLEDSVIATLRQEEINEDFVNWQVIQEDFTSFLQGEGISFDDENVEIKTTVVPQVPWGDVIIIVILVGFGFLVLMMFRGIQGSGNSLMKFGQSKARMIFGRKPEISFKDVAGVDEAKEELREVVLFLKEPKRFLEMGARIPKGLLMVGAPGTGKTLLARAIAGEAGVPFFHTSGSEFEEMLVGAGASRVRDLFEKAKRAAPSIIFIDEIDAVARKRGTTVQSSTTEQTLNQILVEMDGFEKNANVIVIAATNRPDVLDPAILRPGRFDRRIVLDMPDIEGRKQIIQLHAKNKPIDEAVDFEQLARRTVGYSGADIENMLNEAAIITAKDNRKKITFNDLEEAANKVQMGPAKKRKRTEKELKMTAYHEAGHALVMKNTPESDPVHRVTIVSRGMALGYTMPLPETDEVSMSKTKMLSKIKSLVAGHAAEDLVFGDVTSGAANDIEKATSLARRMVKSFGMSDKLGLVKYGQEHELQYLGYGYGEQRDYSEESAKFIDEEVRRIITESYNEARKILTESRSILDKLVGMLLDKEVIEAEEFLAFFR